jgi:hypothetical protein
MNQRNGSNVGSLARTVVNKLFMKDVGRVVGLLLLLVGFVLLFCGWQAQQSMTANLTEVITGDTFAKAVTLLSLGVLAAVAGIFAVLRPS